MQMDVNLSLKRANILSLLVHWCKLHYFIQWPPSSVVQRGHPIDFLSPKVCVGCQRSWEVKNSPWPAFNPAPNPLSASDSVPESSTPSLPQIPFLIWVPWVPFPLWTNISCLHTLRPVRGTSQLPAHISHTSKNRNTISALHADSLITPGTIHTWSALSALFHTFSPQLGPQSVE